MIAKYGDEEIPENEHPQLTSLSVLVKSTRYNLVGAVPSEWTQVDSITGLLIDDIEKLKSGEEQSLRESYPALALADVRILEENRKPKSAAATMGMMLAGAALLLGGVVTLGRGLLD